MSTTAGHPDPEPVPAAPLWHTVAVAEALAALGSGERGLSAEDVARARSRYGENALPERPPRRLVFVFLDQFKSPLIYLLFGAAGIAFALGHTSDGGVICAVVLLNAVVGAFQEGRAERSLSALRTLATQRARVVRDGTEQRLAARELVPGDLLVLDAGDAVTADARLLQASSLAVAEAALTGESLPSRKSLDLLPPDAPLAERGNMLYAGTHVTSGRARALVVATGSAAEIGRIASLSEGGAPNPTPLERRVAQFGRAVIVAACAVFALVLGVGLARGIPMGQILMVAISQVVGLVPEGLPVAMTIALAVGVQRMAARKVVVRKLSAIETLGATTVICTDKTGTLTRNEMTVTCVVLGDGRELEVTGVGYAPVGQLRERGQPLLTPADDAALRPLLEAAALCNDAQLGGGPGGPYQPVGDPTEVALLTLALKAGIAPRDVRGRWPRVHELPFDASAKLMATEHAAGEARYVLVKGAPEAILAMCSHMRRGDVLAPLTRAERAELVGLAAQLAGRALRVLAFAERAGAALDLAAGFPGLRGELVLLGMVGQMDPPRAGVKAAVARSRAAGVRPVMVTGDHEATAVAIARDLGIADAHSAALDGPQLDRLSDAELSAQLGRVAVFARVHPAQKLRIIEALQARGEVVTMTGDGVNDAPALSRADVGVAMGITGTDVAKQAAKVVIADDDFATIVAAVEEGRVVYRNIKKAVLLLFSTSLAEVLVLLLALALGYPPPLAAVQILWNNLITEGLITVNLVMEPAEGDEMAEPPVPRHEALVPRALFGRMLVMTATITAVTLGWYVFRTRAGIPPPQVATETFTLLTICEWYNVLNCRSALHSALSASILRNPWLLGGILAGCVLQWLVVYVPPLGRVFKTVPLSLADALSLAALGSLVLWVEELRKLVARSGRARAHAEAPRAGLVHS